MKETGIVRRVDELGRIVIPSELREKFNLKGKDPIEIFVDDDHIILKKYANTRKCMITGEVSDQNLVMADGDIVLSPEGVEKMMEYMNAYLKKVRKTSEAKTT